MSYTFYKFLHLVGLLGAVGSLFAGCVIALTGQSLSGAARKLVAILHGVGLLLLLVAGFGMLAKGGFGWPWPGWIFVKIGLWLVLGGFIAVVLRNGAVARKLWWVPLATAALAAWLCLYRP